MAATRIWSIKGRLDSVINYVTNSEKTDGSRYTDTELQALTDVIDYAEDGAKTHNKVYVSGINLSPNIARDQMIMTKLQFGKTDKILAYHGYQSFLPGEVTPDMAHEIVNLRSICGAIDSRYLLQRILTTSIFTIIFA